MLPASEWSSSDRRRRKDLRKPQGGRERKPRVCLRRLKAGGETFTDEQMRQQSHCRVGHRDRQAVWRQEA